jgi:uncharacterized membrane protein
MDLKFIPAEWTSVHPIIVHFPIALLLVVPLFILIGAILSPPKGRPFLVSALILLALGTSGLFVAVPTGEAAARLTTGDDQLLEVLRQHQNLAFEARGVFVLLLVLYSAVLLPKVLLRPGRLLSTALPLAFLLFYCTGALLLLDTARHGNALVHKFGLHAVVPCDGKAAFKPDTGNPIAAVMPPDQERKPQ